MIIAVDFDGTLVEHKFPEIGTPIDGAFESLKLFKQKGNKLILWTCRTDGPEGNFLTQAVEYCQLQGVEFDAVNSNIPEAGMISDSRKIYADMYIDDKAYRCTTSYWIMVLSFFNS